MNLQTLVEKAGTRSWYRWLLSYQLNHIVPFNAPHSFTIKSVSPSELCVMLPYKKRNLNHVKGIHACALATLAEATSGFLLVINLKPKKYRIILQKLEMEYHYQAKSRVQAHFRLDENWYQSQIQKPLEAEGKVTVLVQLPIHDADGHHVATGTVHWQIKDWKMVRTKL